MPQEMMKAFESVSAAMTAYVPPFVAEWLAFGVVMTCIGGPMMLALKYAFGGPYGRKKNKYRF